MKEELEKEKLKNKRDKEKKQLDTGDISKKITLEKPETKKILVEKKEKDCKTPVYSGKWELPSINLLSSR